MTRYLDQSHGGEELSISLSGCEHEPVHQFQGPVPLVLVLGNRFVRPRTGSFFMCPRTGEHPVHIATRYHRVGDLPLWSDSDHRLGGTESIALFITECLARS
jgi:hypothetical protein